MKFVLSVKLGIVALLASVGAGFAHATDTKPAKDQADDLQEIVVTANRRVEKAQDVPAAISVISGAQLNSDGIRSSTELGESIPNVTIDTTFASSTPRIYIRGVGSSDFNPNASQPVGAYIDDVFLGSINTLGLQLFDMQRVEVLRGPQGTLYGRNTTAGAINYISVDATEEVSGYLDARVGNYHDQSIQGAISGALIPDKLRIRLAFTEETTDGFILNPVTGDHRQGSVDNYGVRGTADFYPTDNLTAILKFHYVDSDPYSTGYKPRGVFTPGTTTLCPEAQAIAFKCATFLGQVFSSDPYSYTTNSANGRDSNSSGGASLNINYNMHWATLSSITGGEFDTVNRLEDATGSMPIVLGIHYHEPYASVSQELRLTSPGNQEVNWIAGAYYSHERVSANDQYDAPFIAPAPIERDLLQHSTSEAIFGRVDHTFFDRLKISAGARYTEEQIDLDLAETSNAAYFSFFDLPAGPNATFPLFAVSKSLSNGRASGDLTADYRLAPNLLAYVSIREGFKSGGISGALVFSPAGVTTVKPETLIDYEGGLKAQFFDRKLTWNNSAFYYDYRDLQVPTLVDINGEPTQVDENAASAHVYGLESEAIYSPAKGLSFTASLGLLQSKYLNFKSAVTSADYTGHVLPGAPKATAALGLDYSHTIFGTYEAFGNWNSSYRSRNYFDSSEQLRISQVGYWLTNANIGVGPDNHRWTVSVWGKNVFSRQYYRYVNDFSSFGYDAISVGEPATYGLNARINF